jgi:cell wall integrity and stress response component
MKTTTLIVGSLAAATHFLGAMAVMPDPVIAVPDLTRRQNPLQSPSQIAVPGGFTSQGCYKSNANHTLNEAVTGTGVSSGSCRKECIKGNKWTVISLQGSKCFCGTVMPPPSDKASDTKCAYKCPAYGKEACGNIGGTGYYSIFNLGDDIDPPIYVEEEEDDDKDDDKDSGSSTTMGSGPSSTAEPSLPAKTEDNSNEEPTGDEKKDEEDKGGPNVAGIVGGSVVGVVAVAAGAGGLWFFMRRRRNSEIEEEHRRNAAVNAFISGSKPPGSSGSISMTDSRLDPVMAHRRMSDGSIADNEDYSRKILRVTNA